MTVEEIHGRTTYPHIGLYPQNSTVDRPITTNKKVKRKG